MLLSGLSQVIALLSLNVFRNKEIDLNFNPSGRRGFSARGRSACSRDDNFSLIPSFEERRGKRKIVYGNLVVDNDFCVGGMLW